MKKELTLFTDDCTESPSDGLLDSILDFGEMYDGDVTHLSVGAVTFKKDFGPWKVGSRADVITIDYVGGYIEQHDERGQLITKVFVKLTVDTERTE